MAYITKPIALDETLQDVASAIRGITQGGIIASTGTVGSSTQPVYINGGVPTAAGHIMTQTSATVASSGWTAESYTSPTGTVYGYKKDVTISGMTASSYIDGDISSGTYTGAYAFESASGKAVIRTATQPSSSLTFRLYYQI